MRYWKDVLCVTLLAWSVAGCVELSRETDAPEPEQRGITFPTPLVGTATKADTGGALYPQDESFGIFGIYYPSGSFSGWDRTDGSITYINGVEFKYDTGIDDATTGSGAWISDPVYYWPKGGKMTFAAWSPYSVKPSYEDKFGYSASGLSIEDFSTGSNGDCDLMYSERAYDKSSSDGGSNTSYDGIDIVFHHALSALRFNASTSSQDVKVTITRVVLWGFARQGCFRENVTEDIDNPASYASAPSWENLSDHYTVSDPLVVSGPDFETFIIPQEGAPVKDAGMRVYYTVQVGNGNPVPAVSKNLPLLGHTVTGSTDTFDGWKMATRYNYNLLLTDQHQIRFSVNVASWNSCDEEEDTFTISD